ncbi:helix-turn-helix domain-containing protein [Aphanothece sacrum]|uniref:XRE family transcriptional regulator n=1 Tax=Aphanothece sacrum FPU1 TaxID=1920663 RepID=A0A401IH48_APHSA|nr:transcriptional regulator [Aphanothece sacrum]GBF80549.1 XRE family transcriptional regulator [Aphanothece sacrum FPU1]GBF84649.1 XRE family transcriptional regulator [Aphanothece sacrum FPU3]
MMSCELTKNETALFELLVLLIENYESLYYPLEKPTFQATLESLIHEFDVEKNTLVPILGSIETVNNILSGREKICKSQAEKLANFFNSLSSELSLIDEKFRDCL